MKLEPTTSVPKLEAYSRRMREMGFYVLNYFNLAEFGMHIVYPPPPPKREPSDPDLWKDPNDFLYAKLADALLFPPKKELEYREAMSGKPAETGLYHPAFGKQSSCDEAGDSSQRPDQETAPVADPGTGC